MPTSLESSLHFHTNLDEWLGAEIICEYGTGVSQAHVFCREASLQIRCLVNMGSLPKEPAALLPPSEGRRTQATNICTSSCLTGFNEQPGAPHESGQG